MFRGWFIGGLSGSRIGIISLNFQKLGILLLLSERRKVRRVNSKHEFIAFFQQPTADLISCEDIRTIKCKKIYSFLVGN